MKRVWYTNEHPVIGLAPMDGVTDVAFREITVRYGSPDVVFTEFTSVDGLRAGATRLLRDFLYTERQRPLVAQLFGSDPEAFYMAAQLCAELGFDGVDINMGCPAKNITQRGAGASLIREPKQAQAIIASVKQGILDWANGADIRSLPLNPEFLQAVLKRVFEHQTYKKERNIIPVTVKTRLGYANEEIDTWIRQIGEAKPDAVTLHGRTFKQLYSGNADWFSIGKAAAILEDMGIGLLGNGDINSRDQAIELSAVYHLQGVLIGRAAMGNPWVFTGHTPSVKEKLEVASEHCRLVHELLPEEPFVTVRKHLVQYTKGMERAAETRAVLMKLTTYNETEWYLRTVIDSL